MGGHIVRRLLLARDKTLSTGEPGAALFHTVRINLTLWYCGVLGLALILFGIALYVGAQYYLLTPTENNVMADAQRHAQQWLGASLTTACSPSGPPSQFGPPNQSGQPGQPDQSGQGGQANPPPTARFIPLSEMVACFDQNGTLLINSHEDELPTAFLTNMLAKTALQSGQPAHDIVDAGGSIGRIYRYATIVKDPSSGRALGVVVSGEQIEAQETSLSLLLTLLLTVGSIALIGAGIGGLFLANRALVPARLAWSNQQRFIADASHELRTPLTLLRADAEVLLRGRTRMNQEDVALLEDIVAETSHMASLANNMLALARLENGAIRPTHEVVDLGELARHSAKRIKAFANEKAITISIETPQPVYVIGDPILLEQALLVLLDNAVKYNRQHGQIVVSTVEKDGQARLSVRDSGVGIAAEHLAHLGERFYRVDKARSREAGGTGLGLSIAYGIAHMHNGQLLVESIPDQQTTVTLILPPAHNNAPKQLGDQGFV